MLAMEGADKERNRLFLVKHTHIHNTRPFSKTYHLMLAMERADKEKRKTGYFWSTYTTQDHSVKLTS